MKKLLVGIFLFHSLFSYAQKGDMTTVLSDITEKVKSYYIDPTTYKKVDSLFQSELKKGTFNNLNKKDFAALLTQKLRKDIKDGHFFVKYLENYSPEKLVDEKEKVKLNNFHNSLENFGFESVRRLEGNIGYINFKGFASPEASTATLAAAMNFVANTNSLIIDLRENGGGENDMLLLFCSYFFDKKTDLYTTYLRHANKTVMNSTQSNVSGTKYLHKKVYILTSEISFSAAEALAYFLQQHKLAEVIGEKTEGTANPVDHFIIQNEYLLLVPAGKITSLSSHTNWEHIGVMPDQEVKAEYALKTAHSKALKNILKTEKDTKTELSIPEIKNLINKLEQ
ncbi:C-terminal processing protease CtpA/Prc [Chryseobacterium rhizosphaerae]|uniref:S41 family peptidase n=1 Tax=Chryseobacterium rhizosphaerae TaxID=395937 RepID=UPI00286711BE|nr:S41 family peptidase [Chryseobacterium rhizosphaerae]MDR6545529.1 C-terminal processing protease CtpA/Prc [Chryseobacterium rhizosphaerae]